MRSPVPFSRLLPRPDVHPLPQVLGAVSPAGDALRDPTSELVHRDDRDLSPPPTKSTGTSESGSTDLSTTTELTVPESSSPGAPVNCARGTYKLFTRGPSVPPAGTFVSFPEKSLRSRRLPKPRCTSTLSTPDLAIVPVKGRTKFSLSNRTVSRNSDTVSILKCPT